MITVRTHALRAVPLVALVLLLSACGGGGSGGGGGGPVSTPSPTPTPTNADLVTLSRKESFTNNAVKFNVTADSNGTVATSGKTAVTVTYDPANQSYTLATGSTTQTFLATDRPDAAESYYEQATATGSNSLYLTPNSVDTGPLSYRYVGAGVWDRYSENSSGYLDNLTLFTYGAETSDASRPRTGQASYWIDLVATSVNDLYQGTGALYAYFGDGKIAVDASLTGYWGDPYTFQAEATLGSGNSFSGTFATDAIPGGQGSLDGRFYGPNAEEVGAVFSTVTTNYPDAFAGVLVGHQGVFDVPGTTLTNVTSNMTFEYPEAVSGVIYEAADKSAQPSTILAPADSSMRYDFANKTWLAWSSGDMGTLQFADSSKTDTGNYWTFVNGNARMTMLEPGAANTAIALTYASFAKVEFSYTDPATQVKMTRVAYQPFGYDTRVMPTTGTATYNGILMGTGVGTAHHFDLSGTSQFTMNFGGHMLDGTLVISGTDRASGAGVSFGTFTAMASVDAMGDFMGNLFSPNPAPSGVVRGTFYGPTAQELAGVFNGLSEIDPLAAGQSVSLGGVFIAKK